jgi:hypothetical protein
MFDRGDLSEECENNAANRDDQWEQQVIIH